MLLSLQTLYIVQSDCFYESFIDIRRLKYFYMTLILISSHHFKETVPPIWLCRLTAGIWRWISIDLLSKAPKEKEFQSTKKAFERGEKTFANKHQTELHSITTTTKAQQVVKFQVLWMKYVRYKESQAY